jgi:hypothetical protein
MRSGNRIGRAKVFGRIAVLPLLVCGSIEAPTLTPLPTPLAALLSANPLAQLSVVASGLTEARNLRLQTDGSLRLDAPGDALEYRVTPRADGGADVLLAAREMLDELDRASPSAATPVHLDRTPGLEPEADDFDLPRESLETARALARVPQTEAAVAPDGTLFVAAIDEGIVYRVTIPARTSLRAQLLRSRAAR